MTFQKPTPDYWNRKLVAYFHDPIDKVLRIQDHESRAANLLETFGLEAPNQNFWKWADVIASGFERGQVPTYSNKEEENGAIDFIEEPILTHPISKSGTLEIKLPESFNTQPAADSAHKVNEAVKKTLSQIIGVKPGDGGLSDKFIGDPDRFAIARFLYAHLAFRFHLAENNIAELGALWHRIPADSRFPDHSIWQHNALTAALYSCMELAEDQNGVGLLSFSITPVQEFIGNARKLRDFWTGSTILSWLAFEGISWVIENLGPDHVLYPSLIDQPLVNEYLEKKWQFAQISSLNKAYEVASFPNKFLILVPFEKSDEIAAAITEHLKKAWQNLSQLVKNKLLNLAGPFDKSEKETIDTLFERQTGAFWSFNWAASRLVSKENKDEFAEILPENAYKTQLSACEIFNEIIQAIDKNYEKSCVGILYGVSHSLAQTALAATKASRKINRQPEPGEKCHLCGEFEVLHTVPYDGKMGAATYKANINSFWENVREKWGREADFKENEKLCAVCLLKRILYRCFEDSATESHVLRKAFHNQQGFPSTTEIALTNFFNRKEINEKKRKELAQTLYDNKEDPGKLAGEKITDRDKYYAILLMDGDNMGKLVNGQKLASTWESVLHPTMLNRLKNKKFKAAYQKNWAKIFNQKPMRLLTPSIHAAISESLGDFSLYGVPEIIRKYRGKLIYAGGDDVCAVLPVDSAYPAAREIREFYHHTFRLIQRGNVLNIAKEEWAPNDGKLSIGLGKGADISISAAILLCHHKENMGQMIQNTHQLLDKTAKEELGRDACVIELKKRSGGSRYFSAKWDDDSWKAFNALGQAVSKENNDNKSGDVSTSLIYRMELFRDGITAILKSEQDDKNKLLAQLIQAQLKRSSLKAPEGMAEAMANMILSNQNKEREYTPETMIVAAFLGGWRAL